MKLKTGVVGTGYLGQFHAEKYAASPEADLVGIYDTDPARAEEIKNRFGCEAFGSLEDLLARVDAVSVAVPTAKHHEVAKPILESGTHLLIEKPIAGRLEEAEELVRIAEKKRLKLQVGHLERFNPAYVRAFAEISKPAFVESLRISEFSARNIDVNVLLDLMIHDIDLTLHLCPSKVVATEAFGASVLTDSLDISTLRLRFENGCVADLKTSRISDKASRVLRVYSKDRYHAIDFMTQKLRFAKAERGGDGKTTLTRGEESFPKEDLIRKEIDAFIASVKRDETPPITGVEAKYALEVALNAVEEIRQWKAGCSVDI